MTSATSVYSGRGQLLLRRGRWLEAATLAWNVVGVAVLGFAAVTARSVALAGFGLDSLIEIAASAVVLWELSGVGAQRQLRALRFIGIAFALLVVYLTGMSLWALISGFRPHHSLVGILWTALTAIVMFGLAAGKARVGRAMSNPVLIAEGRVTTIDGVLAAAVMAGLVLNSAFSLWWADPAAGLILVFYAGREAAEILAARE